MSLAQGLPSSHALSRTHLLALLRLRMLPSAGLLLRQCRFALERGERLLQASNLRLSLLLRIFVVHWLRNAPLLQLRKVLFDGAKLRGGSLAIRGELGDRLVERSELLRLVLDVLILLRPAYLVLLRSLLVRLLRGCFLSLQLRQVRRKVRLDNLEHTNDATASARGRMTHWPGRLLHEVAEG